MFIYAPLAAYIADIVAKNWADPYSIILISLFLLGMFIVVCLISFELKLYAQNNITQIINSISPLFEKGERFLTLFIGRAASFNIPSWITTDISTYCYFIFTTDRLLVITLSPKIAGINQLNNYHINNTFDHAVNNIYSCSLTDAKKVSFGNFIPQPVFTLTHTKAIVTPVGESESYSWIIADKHTQNGALFKTILNRLSKCYSHSF